MTATVPTIEALSISAAVGKSWFVREFVSLFRIHRRPILLYGGAVRDMLLKGASVKPRDFDFVVDSDMMTLVEESFPRRIVGRNRFGGLQLKWRQIHIDCWPIESTWAFRYGGLRYNTWRDLAQASMLDVDGAVVRISDQFEFELGPFENARKSKTIGLCHHSTINRTIALFRALALGSKYQFGLDQNFLSELDNTVFNFDQELFASLVSKRFKQEDLRPFLDYGLSTVPVSFDHVRRTLSELYDKLEQMPQLEFRFNSFYKGCTCHPGERCQGAKNQQTDCTTVLLRHPPADPELG